MGVDHGGLDVRVPIRFFTVDRSAVAGRKTLKIEVKGLSGSDINTELTPNEYKMLNKHRDDYRVTIVTNALRKDFSTDIFLYSPEDDKWENENRPKVKRQLVICIPNSRTGPTNTISGV